jgi:26S proteasome regulatory subunit N11
MRPVQLNADHLSLKTDIEDVGQELIEDNIVAVSRQMIDKESSVAHVPNTHGAQNGHSMDVDEEL